MLLASSSILWSMLSLNSTPDVPLVLFWSLSLWSLEKALFKATFHHWLLAGIWMGLAFNSKYTASFIALRADALFDPLPHPKKETITSRPMAQFNCMLRSSLPSLLLECPERLCLICLSIYRKIQFSE